MVISCAKGTLPLYLSILMICRQNFPIPTSCRSHLKSLDIPVEIPFFKKNLRMNISPFSDNVLNIICNLLLRIMLKIDQYIFLGTQIVKQIEKPRKNKLPFYRKFCYGRHYPEGGEKDQGSHAIIWF